MGTSATSIGKGVVISFAVRGHEEFGPRPLGTGSGVRSRPDFLLDLIGIALLVATACWMYLAAALSGGDPVPGTALLLAMGAVLVTARMVARTRPEVVPVIVIAAAAGLWLWAPGDFLSSDPSGYPFGYANAKGAFLSQAAIAGVMLLAAARQSRLRDLGLASAALFGVVPFLFGSRAAGILAVAFGTMAVLAGKNKAGIVGFATLAVVAVASTVVLGATHSSSETSAVRTAAQELDSERRLALWHDAFDLMSANPVDGVGLGGFKSSSPTAATDDDIRWVPNAFLEQGAETGIPGMVLLILLFMWGFARLVAGGGSVSVVVAGAAALAAFGVHASIDYILHFPAVPITMAALVGTGLGASNDQGAV